MTAEKPSSLYLKPAVICALIAMAAISRLLPHMMNFAPLGAIALFGAAHFSRKWQALAIPLAAAFLSDLLLNSIVYAGYHGSLVLLHSGFYWQYGAYVLIVALAMKWFSRISASRIIGGAMGSAVLFFAVSNFGVWVNGSMYTLDLAGFIQCYTAAIPFFRGTLAGNLVYSAVLFGSFALLERKYPALRRDDAIPV